MKQETAADKLAKKSFHGKRIQASWNVHMQVFEPVLAPAFVEDYQARYVKMLTAGEQTAVLEELQIALKPVAACLERAPDLHIRREDGKIHICLADCYVIGLRGVYEELLRRMPQELEQNWFFEIVHK